MEFAFTEEQQMIRETAKNFLRDNSTSEMIRDTMATEQGFDPAVWQQLCEELYFHAITIPEQYGGMGLGYIELIAVMEQMGRNLFCSPYFATVCLASNALYVCANEEQQAEYFGKIMQGQRGTLAFNSAFNSTNSSVNVSYKKQDGGYILNGDVRHVIDGHSANFFIVAAKSESDNSSTALFVLPSETEGVSSTYLATMDQTRKQASLHFNNVMLSEAQCLKENANYELQKTLQLASVALAAEQMGGAQQILEMTVDYTKERVQFNRPIASFQAVKHKAANMMLRAEAARSAVYYAACIADETLKCGELMDELPEAASIAQAYCSDAYFQNAGDAIQLHGGVGFTWEYDVHLYFKRAKSSEILLGNATHHREQLAQILLDGEH